MQELLSTTQVAKLLGISRVAVFKRIKAGQIKAKKVGRNFVIERQAIPELSQDLTKAVKQAVEQSVKKTVTEYRETLKLLGKE